MINYNPDGFNIIKISVDSKVFYKVFGAWIGGGLTGTPAWRLNSGITNYEIKGDSIMFYGASGSVYECKRDTEGFGCTFTQDVLDNFLAQSKDNVKVESIALESFIEEFVNEE